jgi:hypothetical protein
MRGIAANRIVATMTDAKPFKDLLACRLDERYAMSVLHSATKPNPTTNIGRVLGIDQTLSNPRPAFIRPAALINARPKVFSTLVTPHE